MNVGSTSLVEICVRHPRRELQGITRSTDQKQRIHHQTYLGNFNGVLQAGFNELYRAGHIKEVVCWAHARRKIHDIHVRTPSVLTDEDLKRIRPAVCHRNRAARVVGGQPQLRAKPQLNGLEDGYVKKRRHCRATSSWQKRSSMH